MRASLRQDERFDNRRHIPWYTCNGCTRDL
nr:MAG TPA: hypothetical protein [Bacteriophage sp.]